MAADNDVFLAGSTSKQVYVLDRRVKSTGAIVMLLSSDAKVSALIVYRNGIACLSGDWHGAMKLWDLRTKACVETVYNEDFHKPITSLDMSHASDGKFMHNLDLSAIVTCSVSHSDLFRISRNDYLEPFSELYMLSTNAIFDLIFTLFSIFFILDWDLSLLLRYRW